MSSPVSPNIGWNMVAPFRIIPAIDVFPTDPRGWAEKNLETYGPLVEPFASSVVAEGPVAPLMAQLTPAIVGLQVGSLVGSLSSWIVASFDAGLPQDRPGHLAVIVPNIEELSHDRRAWTGERSGSGSSPMKLPFGRFPNCPGFRIISTTSSPTTPRRSASIRPSSAG